MNLKTLKDFKWKQNMKVSALCDELKAEAIKWIKYRTGKEYVETGKGDVEHWIIHFFNIKKEDLKDD